MAGTERVVVQWWRRVQCLHGKERTPEGDDARRGDCATTAQRGRPFGLRVEDARRQTRGRLEDQDRAVGAGHQAGLVVRTIRERNDRDNVANDVATT